MRVFHQNESCLACHHPLSSYEGGREKEGSSHFDEKLSFWMDTTIFYQYPFSFPTGRSIFPSTWKVWLKCFGMEALSIICRDGKKRHAATGERHYLLTYEVARKKKLWCKHFKFCNIPLLWFFYLLSFAFPNFRPLLKWIWNPVQ